MDLLRGFRPRRGWLVAGLACLALGVCGCGGPKRLPPVITAAESVPGLKAAAPALLGIGLAEDRAAIVLVTGGPSVLTSAEDGSRLLAVNETGRKVVLERRGPRVFWRSGADSGSATRIRLEPLDPGDLPVFDGRSYRGDFLVVPSPGGNGLTLINNVDLEAYLRGVVPWEIGRHDKSATAALEAQAVAARTYTISHLQERADHGFDLFADVMDQVYKGSDGEDPLCNLAIRRTRGLVLESGSELVEAYYSACCGGTTSRIEKVWPRSARPYLVDHPDAPGPGDEPFCSQYKYYTWSQSWSPGQLTAILQRTLPEYHEAFATGARARWAGPIFSPQSRTANPLQPGELLDLEILDRTPSGRVATLAVTTTAGTYRVRGDRVRWVLARPGPGGGILRSAMFDLELERDGHGITSVTARGRGYGHGIGMCQAGALVMARRGYDFAAILSHYYPGSRLARLRSGSRP